MNFSERISAVLHGRMPDKVPFAPYDNLVPRGDFEREMRNRGMGLCARRSSIWSACEGVRTETELQGDARLTTYHTPVGSVSTGRRTHLGRIDDSGSVQQEWMIKTIADYDPVIYMIQHTTFHADDHAHRDVVRDLGTDGIVRGRGLGAPYDATEEYFGLVSWAYAQSDHPAHFRRLLDALDEQQERLFPLVASSPAEFVAFGSMSGSYGPKQYREHTLPFCQKYVPLLKEQGKICALHAHNSNLRAFADLIAQTSVPVIEAYTPPPISDLPIDEARAAWGKDVVIWVNFPETVFWYGREQTRAYTLDLLECDPRPERLVIGMTEMGTYGIIDDETERAFKDGLRAIVDAIDEFSGL
jgi:hypothetical protein